MQKPNLFRTWQPGDVKTLLWLGAGFAIGLWLATL